MTPLTPLPRDLHSYPFNPPPTPAQHPLAFGPPQLPPPVATVDLSKSKAFQALRDRILILKPSVSPYKTLQIPLKHLYQGLPPHDDLIVSGSSAGNLVGGPPPNDLDIEVPLKVTPPRSQKDHAIEEIWRSLIQTIKLQAESLTKIALQSIYQCDVKPIPNHRGWVINVGPDVQFILKAYSNDLQSLSWLDSLKVSLLTGRMWAVLGRQPITNPNEFYQIIEKVRLRDIYNGVIQHPQVKGLFFRLLHYWAHGTIIASADLDRGLGEIMHLYPYEQLEREFIRHQRLHFRDPSSKLIDYLNCLTLCESIPASCHAFSEIWWTNRSQLGLSDHQAKLAYLIRTSPKLTPYLLRFIRGAIFHQMVSSSENSAIQAWVLPFLKTSSKLRHFFWFSNSTLPRCLSMCLPSQQQSPNSLISEFLQAWGELEALLPQANAHFLDLKGAFTLLGISSTVLSFNNRSQVIQELASASDMPSIQKLRYDFPSDEFESESLFRRVSSRIKLPSLVANQWKAQIHLKQLGTLPNLRQLPLQLLIDISRQPPSSFSLEDMRKIMAQFKNIMIQTPCPMSAKREVLGNEAIAEARLLKNRPSFSPQVWRKFGLSFNTVLFPRLQGLLRQPHPSQRKELAAQGKAGQFALQLLHIIKETHLPLKQTVRIIHKKLLKIAAKQHTPLDKREQPLVRLTEERMARRHLEKLTHWLSQQGLCMDLLNQCFSEPRLHRFGLESVLDAPPLPPVLMDKLVGMLKATYEGLSTAPSVMRWHWVKAAELVMQPALEGLYRKTLSNLPASDQFSDALADLFQLRNRMRQGEPAQEILPYMKRIEASHGAIRHLSSWRKTLFRKTLLTLGPKKAEDIPLMERLAEMARQCQLLNLEELDRLHLRVVASAGQLHPQRLGALLKKAIQYRQAVFGSVFARPTTLLIHALDSLIRSKNSSEKIIDQCFHLLLEDLFAQPAQKRPEILHHLIPFVTSCVHVQEEELLAATSRIFTRLFGLLDTAREIRGAVNPGLKKCLAGNRKLCEKVNKAKKRRQKASPEPKPSAVVFAEALKRGKVERAAEVYASAHEKLERGALVEFNVEATAALKTQRSLLNSGARQADVQRFIQETIQLLPVYAKLLPSKAQLRIEILLNNSSEALKSYPLELSRLLFNAIDLRIFRHLKPFDIHTLHAKAVEGLCSDLPHGDQSACIFNHLDKMVLIKHVNTLSHAQTAELYQLQLRVALAFLRKAFSRYGPKEQCDFADFRHFFNVYFKPCLSQNPELGIAPVRTLLIAICGIPVVLCVLYKKVASSPSSVSRLNLMKEIAKDILSLSAILNPKTAASIDSVQGLPSEDIDDLMTHVISLMRSCTDENAPVISNVVRFHSIWEDILGVFNLLQTLSNTHALQHEKKYSETGFNQLLIDVWNHNSQGLTTLCQWASDCYSIITGREEPISPFTVKLALITHERIAGIIKFTCNSTNKQ